MAVSTSISEVPRELTHPAELAGPMFVPNLKNAFTWGQDRGITRENGATPRAQMSKLVEEADEAVEAFERGDISEAQDGIGDCLVVLVQMARLMGVPFDTAMERAWKDIKDRKGQLRHGVFVKQKDIDAFLSQGKSLEDFKTLEELTTALENRNGK